jgi:ferredoxin/flavodoxin
MERLKSPVSIYWFSSSGNSLIIAREIRDQLRRRGLAADLRPLDRSDPESVDPGSAVGFVVPVAGQGTYPFVWEFLERLPEADGTPCFLVDTLGMYSGGILGPARRILKRKGYAPLAAEEILMPNIFRKRNPDPARDAERVERGREEARRFCERLAAGEGRWNDIPIYSDFLSLFYRYRSLVGAWKRLFPWRVDGAKCSSCGICARLCPERSLTMDAASGLPVNGERCALCQRCFAFCPAGAIAIGGPGAVAYKAVTLREMLEALGG